MIPRPDTWDVFRLGPGLDDATIERLYGPQLSFADTEDNLVEQARRAHRALQTALLSVHRSKDVLRAAFPQLSSRRVNQRALLLRTPDGKWFPVAHIGPIAYSLLTEDLAHESIQGRDSQHPPPGDFVQVGLIPKTKQAIDAGADFVTDTINSPVPRMLLALGGVFATGVAVWSAWKSVWPVLQQRLR